MLKLQAHSSNPNEKYGVWADYKFTNNFIKIHFKVEKEVLALSPDFDSKDWNNWGLWEFDVVEVFLSRHDNEKRYLEMQISPLNQKFALDVYEPRVKFEKIHTLNSNATAKKTKDGFQAHFEIDINELPGDQEIIRGNLHACLHHGDSTYFFGLNINPEKKADFHRPDLFVELNP